MSADEKQEPSGEDVEAHRFVTDEPEDDGDPERTRTRARTRLDEDPGPESDELIHKT